jgi:hypothetical protein
VVLTEAECLARLNVRNTWQGGGTSCSPDPCPQYGCCCKNGIASVVSQSYCTSIGGVFTAGPCFGVVCTTTTTTAPPTTEPV